MSENKLTDKRMGEIAVALTKYRFVRDGIFLKNSGKRDIGNFVKDFGIPPEEVMEFLRIVIVEITEDFFAGGENEKQQIKK